MFIKRIVVPLFLTMLLYSCANVVAPTGGQKDTSPPKTEKMIPENNTAAFNSKEILIYFDEFVQLKNYTEEFVVSPPMSENPELKSLGKKILVKFPDSLKENTTYTLNFGSSIADITEGNTMHEFKYVFSTGENIDSISISGKVKKAQTFESPEKAFVLLYSNLNDTTPLKIKPDYIAKCNKDGKFTIYNIKPGNYKIYAISDANNNLIFDLPNELFAFNDSIYNLNYDYLTDSLSKGITDINLFLFEEETAKRFVKDKQRETPNLCTTIFNLPLHEKANFNLIDFDSSAFITEYNKSNDTVNLWIADSTLISKDTLLFVAEYYYINDFDSIIQIADTLKFINKKQKEKAEKEKFIIKSSFDKTNLLSDLSSFILNFTSPIEKFDTSRIFFVEKIDTILKPVQFSFKQDSISITKYYVDFPKNKNSNYIFTLDSGAIQNIYNQYNDSTSYLFKISELENIGNIFLTLENVKPNIIVQLLNDKGKLVDEKIVKTSGKVIFSNLKEGVYKLNAIFDENKDNRWSSGKYIKKQQPEDVKSYSKEITLKSNWDFEITWDLNEVSIVEEPKQKKQKELPNLPKNNK